jgi:hypothetical protein
MINVALAYVRDLLNEHFKNEFQISENKVVLSNIVNSDGGIAQNVEGKIVLFLVSLNEESTLRNSINRSLGADGGSLSKKVPTLHLNIQVLFCANFESTIYSEGLSYLSSLIRFFQINKKIQINPLNGKNSNHISFELCSLDYSEISHLWSAIGSKLMPAALYKVGILMFDETPITAITPTVNKPQTKL